MAKKDNTQIMVTNRKANRKLLPFILFVMLAMYASLFFLRQINLLNIDLGRHITNGKVFVETGQVISTNFYSYTQPNLEVINHHWFSGVIFFELQKLLGFDGLHIFYVMVLLSAVILFAFTALRYADARIVFAVTVFVVPIIASRTEVRPEGFSLLLVGLFVYVLTLFRERKLSFGYVLPLLFVAQVLWVNLHILFFLGIVLCLIFLVDDYLCHPVNNQKHKSYILLTLALMGASLLNPAFIKGALVPFTIFKEYGYMVSENQSVQFMQDKTHSFLYAHYELLAAMLVVLLAAYIWKQGEEQPWFLWLLAGAFGLLGFMAVRAMPMFALAAIPAGGFLLQYFFNQIKTGTRTLLLNGFAVIAVLIATGSTVSGYFTDMENKAPAAVYQEPAYYSAIKYTTGVGLVPNINAAADFYLQNHIQGPVFNDFDIGAYLIYHLYGQQRVFVDQRPEAYTVSFFKDTYIPMQANFEKFRAEEANYNFNCVWFYMHEDAPWANRFLWQLMDQPDYAPVFSDGLSIIFLKRNAVNASLIAAHEIPKSMFGRGPRR